MNETDNMNLNVQNDPVNHPSHYTSHPSGVETIEVARGFDYDCGNAWKYLTRFRYKVNPIEDLKKAVWYINDKLASSDNKKSLPEQAAPTLYGEVFYKVKRVIAAEPDVAVQSALQLVAELAFFGHPLFSCAEDVVRNLNDHIEWCQNTYNKYKAEEDYVNTAEKILEKLDESDKAKAQIQSTPESDANFNQLMDAIKPTEQDDAFANSMNREETLQNVLDYMPSAVDDNVVTVTVDKTDNKVIRSAAAYILAVDANHELVSELVKLPESMRHEAPTIRQEYACSLVENGIYAKQHMLEAGEKQQNAEVVAEPKRKLEKSDVEVVGKRKKKK